jgi:hypothetical protein
MLTAHRHPNGIQQAHGEEILKVFRLSRIQRPIARMLR